MKVFVVVNEITNKIQVADSFENAMNLFHEEVDYNTYRGHDLSTATFFEREVITDTKTIIPFTKVSTINPDLEKSYNKQGVYFTKTGKPLTIK